MQSLISTMWANKEIGVQHRVLWRTIDWPVESDGTPKTPPWDAGDYPTYASSTDITGDVSTWIIHVSHDALTEISLTVLSGNYEYGDVIEIQARYRGGGADTGWISIGWGQISTIDMQDSGQSQLTALGPIRQLKLRTYYGTLEGDKIEESSKALTEILGSGVGDPAYEFVDGSSSSHTYNWCKVPPPEVRTSSGRVLAADNIQYLFGEGIVRIDKEYYEDKGSPSLVCDYWRYATTSDSSYDPNLVVDDLSNPSRLKDVLLEAGFQTFDSSAPFYIEELPSLSTPVYAPPLHFRLDQGQSCYAVFQQLAKFLPPNFRLLENQTGGIKGVLLEEDTVETITQPYRIQRAERDSQLYTAVYVRGYSHANAGRNLAWSANGATITALHSPLANGWSGYADEHIVDGVEKVQNLIDNSGKHNVKWRVRGDIPSGATDDPFEGVELAEIDLGDTYEIDKLVLFNSQKSSGDYGVETLDILYSVDGSTWHDLALALQPLKDEPMVVPSSQWVTNGAVEARYIRLRCAQSWQKVSGGAWLLAQSYRAEVALRELEIFPGEYLTATAILGETTGYTTDTDKAWAARLGRRWLIVPDVYYGLDQSKSLADQQSDLEDYAKLWLDEVRRDFSPYIVTCWRQDMIIGDTVAVGSIEGLVREIEFNADGSARVVVVAYDS